MKRIKKITTVFLIFILVFAANPIKVWAAGRQRYINIRVSVDGIDKGEIPAFDDDYENNLYVSVKGLAFALNGTDKEFLPEVEKGEILIETGEGFSHPSAIWDQEKLSGSGNASPRKYDLFVDDIERKYYSFILSKDEGFDAFIAPISIAMMLDMNIKVTDGRLEIDTQNSFAVSAEDMEKSGYLQGVNSLVIGDGTTGEIYYAYEKDEIVPIASTTKLMSYMIIMDAISNGEISPDEKIKISEKAAELSVSSNGVIYMKAGATATLTELLYGMLLPSSNESALAMAERVAGNEEGFVKRMQDKARSLGLENAEFYNCHGLPVYEDQLIPAKLQNHMTAEEMFRLASVIVETYPQITEITSTKEYHMSTFDRDIQNTNPVIYNVDGAVGLKTGTTNKAGACLVTCSVVEKDGAPHNLITVLMGAEEDASRGLVSEISARYAISHLQEIGPGAVDQANNKFIPEDPEEVVREIIKAVYEKNIDNK